MTTLRRTRDLVQHFRKRLQNTASSVPIYVLSPHWLQITIGILFVALLAWSLADSVNWPFALRAQSRFVELELNRETETRWNISDAALCLRDALSNPEPYEAVNEPTRIAELCGSQQLAAYLPAEDYPGARELIAIVGGQAESSSAASLARISSIRSGRFIVDIDTSRQSEAEPTIRIADSSGVLLNLTAPVSFNWLPGKANRPLIFPYTGAIRVGQDVNATRTELLESGHISIFSPSNQTVGGRALVQKIDLMPGDMVDLSAKTSNASPGYARGFVRVTANQMAENWPLMDVLAYGFSRSVRVHRFGDVGLDFGPSLWTRIKNNDVAIILSLFLFGGGLSVLWSTLSRPGK